MTNTWDDVYDQETKAMTDAVVLTSGSHSSPHKGMCVMEYVSFKYGLGFTDLPSCTESVIARTAQWINDTVSHEDRQRLALRVDRLFAAHPVRDEHKRHRVLVRLAVWAARRVLDHVSDKDRAVCERAIEAAEGWLDGSVAAYAAYAAYASAASYANAYASAAYAASAAAYAASAASYASYASAASAAAYAAAYAAYAAELDLVEWLDDMLDAYDKARVEEGVMADEVPA